MSSAAGLALAAVWIVAAVAKLRSPAATGAELAALGVPAPRLLAWVLPGLELVASVALVVSPGAGAALSLALLGPFTAVLVLAVRSGRPATCGCLGSWSRAPVSWLTVGRNAVLMALAAGGAGWGPGQGAGLDVASMVAVATALLIVVVIAELLRLRLAIGRIWSVQLAGDPVPDHGRRLRP